MTNAMATKLNEKNFAGYKDMKDEKSFLDACLEVYAQRSFLQNYNNTFELVRADTDAQKVDVYRLRYDVFCEENKFEKPPYEGDVLEFDALDDRSVHYLLMHKPTGEAVGTVRVTLPNDEYPAESFLMQRNVQHPLLRSDSKALAMC